MEHIFKNQLTYMHKKKKKKRHFVQIPAEKFYLDDCRVQMWSSQTEKLLV